MQAYLFCFTKSTDILSLRKSSTQNARAWPQSIPWLCLLLHQVPARVSKSQAALRIVAVRRCVCQFKLRIKLNVLGWGTHQTSVRSEVGWWRMDHLLVHCEVNP